MKAQAKKQNSFLYEGIKNGLIKVESSGDMSWDIDKFLSDPKGKIQLKKITDSLSKIK